MVVHGVKTTFTSLPFDKCDTLFQLMQPCFRLSEHVCYQCHFPSIGSAFTQYTFTAYRSTTQSSCTRPTRREMLTHCKDRIEAHTTCFSGSPNIQSYGAYRTEEYFDAPIFLWILLMHTWFLGTCIHVHV